VNTGANPTSAVLQYCASGSDKFYLLTSASQTLTVFNSIGSRSCAWPNNQARIGARKSPAETAGLFVFDRRRAD
jgi:hypothetical protein